MRSAPVDGFQAFHQLPLSQVELRPLDGVGHFTPLEAPQAFADAIGEALAAL